MMNFSQIFSIVLGAVCIGLVLLLVPDMLPKSLACIVIAALSVAAFRAKD